jgi:serine beta-lactamase-like protein LACTB
MEKRNMTRLERGMNASRLLVVALVAVGLVPGAVLAQVQSTVIEDYLQQVRRTTGVPGISLAVAKDGVMIYSGGVGYAELQNRTPADGTTVHNVGSVSKVLATVAVMQLVEKGAVALDDVIQKYVPSFPKKQAPITLQHILTHTSGIRHYRGGEFGPHGLREMRRFEDIEEAMKHFSDDPLLFDPGQYWSYSSHAFNLLQGVIEKSSGMKFEAYMRKYVFEPAGMLSSSFDVPERVVHKRGQGYVRNDDGVWTHPRYVDPSYKYAGGGMLSTVEDLVRFCIAINDGTLLEPKTVEMMHRVQVDPVVQFRAEGEPEKQAFKQALGWRIDEDVEGRPYINHTGTVKGTRSFVLNYPDIGLVLALQANGLPFDSREHGAAIAQMFLPPVHEGVQASKESR